MSYLIYPSLQQPVLAAAQQPETVTEDRWHQPLSEPTGRTNAKRAAAIAIALLASGQFMSPNSLPNTGQTIDMWGYAWSEPVRVKPRLATPAQAHFGFVQAAPFDETVLPDKYFVPLSEPVRVPQRLATGSQQVFATSAQALTDPETVFIDKYLYPLSEPVRVKQALKEALQQTTAISPVALTLAEQVFESKWHQPFSEPQRDLQGRRNRGHLLAAHQQVEPLNPFGVTQPETVRINKYLIGLSEPVRLPKGLAAHQQQFFTISAAAFIVPEFVPVDRWLSNLSEPVRIKPGLRPEQQYTATIDPFALTLRRRSAKSYLIV